MMPDGEPAPLPDDPAGEGAPGDGFLLTQVSGSLRTELLHELQQQQQPDPVAAAKADVAKYETMLRDDPRSYWNNPAHQTAYHDALTVLRG
jgi:hypothetical protein